MSIFLFIGGLQLLCIGIIGKYIGKIFLETKNRPIFIVKEDEELYLEKMQQNKESSLVSVKNENDLAQ